MLRILVVGLLAALCQAQDVYTIAGHVVRHLDQRPAPGLRVSIAMVKEQGRQVTVVSGENGEFAFNGVPAGKYQLSVTEHGVTRLYWQFDFFSTAIVTGPNLDTEHIVFTLESAASITGSVVDEDNEPVQQIQVFLFHKGIRLGKYETRMQAGGMTDMGGRFHFRGLEPGSYYVAVVGRPWYAQFGNQPNMSAEIDVAYPVTYYGGATSAEGATPLRLEEGQKADLQISVRAVPALHVKLDGLPTGPVTEGQMLPRHIARQRGVMLAQTGPGGALIHLPVAMGNNELVGVAPGRYTVTYGSETQTVTLTGNTELQLGGGVETWVKGRVILDGQGEAARPNVSLSDEQGRGFFSGPVQPDGTFEIQNLAAGRYQLGLANEQGTYIAKAEVKGATYIDGELDVAAGAHVELLITPGQGFTEVNGIAVEDKKPQAGAMVLLIPQDRKSGRGIGRDQSDADGTFAIPSVVPGRYLLVAIDDGKGLAYADREAMAPYLQHGLVVDVPMSKPASVEVQHRLQ